MAQVQALYIAAEKRGPVSRHPALKVEAGRGIVGDRRYRRNTPPAEQITLIESEQVAAFNREFGVRVEPGALRRNVITEGVDLNALEGRLFQVGGILMRGIELCEPCSVVGHLLAGPSLSPAQVVRGLTGRGGLRAEVLASGVLREGDPIRAHEPEPSA
ncbi:MOSC domain-containing protein [Alloalcanivorax gelatiniphagus]|uniref:MOSC domain-containing protein n=1 Tax=Alloalcanivorax gelatiniphagus TaxID=1194167 RepID=A0ABY2XHU3_9GAMM|nr:MOSC domain-containing protein [Alloalcanivorax gelatiniphagus]TMW11324.1 MOSC domain-containing protein [Alloalcanivorax gelatiniphagus]|tara:strand:- start:6985 stop:7461 length:477 start_codon:yes stop_codon:yes gene_type:complete